MSVPWRLEAESRLPSPASATVAADVASCRSRPFGFRQVQRELKPVAILRLSTTLPSSGEPFSCSLMLLAARVP